jgi:hypothetical protein
MSLELATDNGSEFASDLSNENAMLFEQVLAYHGIRYKLISVFTQRHNSKGEYFATNNGYLL